MPRLKKLDKASVVDSTFWKPPEAKVKYKCKTNSWFNITKFNKKVRRGKAAPIESKTIRSRPITIRPNLTQKHILLQWFEIYRQVYNVTVAYLKINKKSGFRKMRVIIHDMINESKPELKALIEEYSMPRTMRDNAVKDCIKAYNIAFINLKRNNIRHFKIRYKKKKHHLHSVVLEPTQFSKKINGFCITVLGAMDSAETFSGINRESRLCYNSRTNKFCIRVPYDKVVKTELRRSKVISLDPGMRTFQTCYTPSGNCYEICSGKYAQGIKDIINKIQNVKKDNINYTKYVSRLREKLTNKVKDMHWKASNFLCKNFNTVIIGNMSTKGIISNKRNLHKSVKRHCMALSHYSFRERLISKAEEYNCNVIVADESYTSKTCGGCGEINDNLGSSKHFSCVCGYTCDRDVNAARNILIKYKSLL